MRTFTRFFMGDTEPDARNEARMWSKPGQIGDITRVVDISDQLIGKVAHGLGGPLQQGLGSQVVAGTRVWAVTQQVAW